MSDGQSNTGLGDPVAFGRELGKLLREEIVTPFKKRLADLEKEGVIDALVIDELAELLGRVDAIESGGGPLRKKFLGQDSAESAAHLDRGMDDAVARYFSANPVSPGRGVQSALIDRDGQLVLTMTDGTTQKLGCVVGRDGLSVESRELEYLPETHEIVERWSTGGARKEFRYPAGGIHDGGYWRDGMEVQACRAVTHAGSLWIARRTTKAKPCIESDDWRIAARKGRDGKSAND